MSAFELPEGYTPASSDQWCLSGVRFRMNGGEWHNLLGKDDEHVACVSYAAGQRTAANARLIALAPAMVLEIRRLEGEVARLTRLLEAAT